MKATFSYNEILKDHRWIKRRNEILTRDKNTCQFCGAQDKYLHVHHKEYFDGFLPWEYQDDMLVTLCNECHKHFHENMEESIKCNEAAQIGDIYSFFHSDWENTCIIYHIDYVNKMVYTLEYDNGASWDNIYEKELTFQYFHNRYHKIENCNKEVFDYNFFLWFVYLSDHLDITPWPFRYNYNLILKNNSFLKGIINEREEYGNRY